MIRVYSINDCDWYAGDCTPTEILAFYMTELGCTIEDAIGDVENLPDALTYSELENLRFNDDNGNVYTFNIHLENLISAGQTFPCFFASTEI